MTAGALFLTHAEVVNDPEVPVPDWPLSDQGRARHVGFAQSADCSQVTTLFCSDERKARDGAEITAGQRDCRPRIRPQLRENDRSVTGYLPKEEFQRTATEFFGDPATSVRGWETAVDAQARILKAVTEALSEDRPDGDVLFISHGGVSALLRCHLLGRPITRDEDQPANGGCWFAFDHCLTSAPTDWRVI